VARKWHKTFIL